MVAAFVSYREAERCIGEGDEDVRGKGWEDACIVVTTHELTWLASLQLILTTHKSWTRGYIIKGFF